MWHLYETPISWPPSLEDMYLDLSFARLLSVANGRIAYDLARAEREESRTRKSTQAKRKIGDRHQFLLAIYNYGESIAPGEKLSKSIKIIQRQFEESKKSKLNESRREDPKWGAIPDNIKTPKRDSIIDLLTKTGILDRDFEKRGRYWFKRT
jgi:hypothetical protein